MKNFTTNAIRNEKKAYLNHKISVGNSKTLWKELDNLSIYSKKKKGDIPSDIGNADDINKFFINSVRNLSNTNVQDMINFYSQHFKSSFGDKLVFTAVNEIDILSIINSITSDALGSDKINITMLKYCCPYILPFITHIMNVCIINNVFPDCWKTSHVTPLPKIDSPEQLKDLRPISILPPLSKVLEKIVSSQIRKHLQIYNILPAYQSGFRPNHSCTTALAHITDEIIKSTDDNKLTALILLDYSKAFDCINHKILYSICSYIGLSTNSITFLTNYLTNRKQIVKFNNQLSNALILDRGVPQGSILGPLLFSIYTSNLHICLTQCSVHCYADDTQLFYSFKPEDIYIANTIINNDIHNLAEASHEHNLIINPSKTVLMLFGKSKVRNHYKNLINIKIDDTPLECVNEAKNLGLLMDTELRFKKHINNCIKKAMANLKKIYSSKDLLTKKTKQLLCDTLVLSHFSYCDAVYGPCLDVATSRRIQLVQNACTRLICGVRKREHISHKIKEIKWLNMSNRRALHASVLYHKIVTTHVPPYLYNKIRFRTDVHNINIRRKSIITPPSHRTTLFQRSFRFNIYKTYNAISADFKLKSILAFKYSMRKAMLETQ